MSVTLAPLTPTVIQTPWGSEVIQPTADEVLIYAALQALASGTPMTPVSASYPSATPFGPMTFQYKPATLAIISAISAIAAGK